MGTRGTNTMSEGLQKLMQDITGLKATPDADVAFLIGLETTILSKLREQFAGAAEQMPPPPGNAVEMGAGAGMEAAGAEMMGAGMGAMAGAGVPMGGGGVAAGLPGPGGPMPAPPGPRFSPDVMRRALRGGGIQGG